MYIAEEGIPIVLKKKKNHKTLSHVSSFLKKKKKTYMAVPTPFHNPLIPLSALTAATSFQNPPVPVPVLPIAPETAPVELFIELNRLFTPILEDPPPAPAPPKCKLPRATPGPSRRTNTPAPPPPPPGTLDGIGSPHIPAHLEGFKHPLGGRSAFTPVPALVLVPEDRDGEGEGEGRMEEMSIPFLIDGTETDDEWVQTSGCSGFILVPETPEYVVWQQSAAAAAAALVFPWLTAADEKGGKEGETADGCK